MIPNLNAKGDESRLKFLRIFTALIALLLLGVGDSRASEINFDKIPMSQTKFDFLMLYKTQWELFRLPNKLKHAVDDAFTEQTENLMWGTMRAQLVSNYDNIQEKIQQATEYKFNADYDKFLSELEDTWGEKLRSNIMDFYKRQSEVMYFELGANPMAQAYLRQDYDRLTEDNGHDAMTRISSELSKKYGTFTVSGVGVIGGGLMVLARKQLQKYVTQIIARKFTGTAIGKAAGIAVPVIGWAMFIWSAWDIYSMLSEAEDTIKAKIFESYNVMYSEEVPLVYWEGMEAYVKDAYILAYNTLSESVEKGISLSENPHVKELSHGLTKSEQRFFADRVAVIHEISDGKNYTVDDVLTRYGEFIRDSKHREFDKFAAMIAESDTLPENYPPDSPTTPAIIPAISHDTASTDINPESQSQKTFRIHEGH